MTPEKTLFPELVDNRRGLMPEGFRYEEDIISEADEAALAKSLATLDLKPFEFHGHLGNRRVTSFGLRYDYGSTCREGYGWISRLCCRPADQSG
jgi:hypothetical protein